MDQIIHSRRLVLRPLNLIDVDRLYLLLQEREISANTRSIPHPYPAEAAQPWVEEQLAAEKSGEAIVRAITRKSDPVIQESKSELRPLIGVVGLAIDQQNQHAELGYWVGKPHWGEGYCTEAASELIRFGFENLGLHRIHAHHFARNPASGRVLSKLGMKQEGMLRQHVRKWGVFEDVVFYGLLASELDVVKK